MSTLVLDRAGMSVRAEGGALALYEGDTRRGTVPIKLLERVVVHGASLQLASAVILALAEEGVAMLFLSPRRARRVAIVLGPAHNDATVRLAQARRVTDEAFRLDWSRRIVAAKIRRQRMFVARALERRADARKPLYDALQVLDAMHETVASNAASVGELRGLEGAAAAAYFRGIASVFAPGLGFAGRNRRPPRDPVNACLSLAYTLLHFDAVRAAHAAGLDPLLGFYHRPAYGRESLASDLIEPLRPTVDEWVWRLFAERSLREDSFKHDKGACLLGKAGRQRFYPAWEPFAKAPRRYLRRRCAALARALRSDGEGFMAAWKGADDEEVCA